MHMIVNVLFLYITLIGHKIFTSIMSKIYVHSKNINLCKYEKVISSPENI